MSNKIVPNIYRAVIDDVINSIKPEFEEYGVSEDVLADLQHKWQNKVMASNVAEFDSLSPPQPHQSFPPHPMHVMQTYGSYPPPPAPVQPHVKSEPVDNRYVLSTPPAYTLPPLPGPQLAARPGVAHQAVLSFSQGALPLQPQQNTATRPYTARIPQVDGPSNSDDDDESPSPGGYAPRSNHPSLPQPQSQTSTTKDEEAINSDLDDSDSENEEDAEDGSAAESDIVFCTYDKVARVKNKWKCVLKDGMIHVNGKDYLFQNEFEW